jgi:hypothetical protein
MRWFSLWVPLVLQLVVPLSLVGWVAAVRGARAVRIAWAALTALYLMAIGLAGLWLVLPWWLPFGYAVVLLAAARRGHRAPPQARPTKAARLAVVTLGLGSLLLAAVVVLVLVARRPPRVRPSNWTSRSRTAPTWSSMAATTS